jgi:hypothetical protein
MSLRANASPSSCILTAVSNTGPTTLIKSDIATMNNLVNSERADTVREILSSHFDVNEDSDPGDVQAAVTDLLTNLRHFCVAAAINYSQRSHMAEIHFNEEQAESLPSHSERPLTQAVCAGCKQSKVLRDAFAVWSPDNRDWVLLAVLDSFQCQECDGDCNVEFVPVATAPTNLEQLLSG